MSDALMWVREYLPAPRHNRANSMLHGNSREYFTPVIYTYIYIEVIVQDSYVFLMMSIIFCNGL